MKIFGDPRSTNTRKVLTTLAELEMPYELVHVDFARGEHKHEAHLQRQPFGQVPALDDDGFVLYETHAMCRYLDARAGGALMPSDLRARATADQWMSVESANFSSYAMKFVYHYLLKVEADAGTLAHAEAGLDRTLAILERELAARPYFEYALWTPAKASISKHPSVLSWWSRVRERPSWRKVAGRAAA